MLSIIYFVNLMQKLVILNLLEAISKLLDNVKIINKNKFQPIISADTAGSAKELAEGSDKSIAAIASDLSAKIYQLKILEKY